MTVIETSFAIVGVGFVMYLLINIAHDETDD